MIFGWSSFANVISPFNSLSLQEVSITKSKLGKAFDIKYNQFPGQSVGVAGFLGVLTATRMFPLAVSRASQTKPTEDTSLKNTFQIIRRRIGSIDKQTNLARINLYIWNLPPRRVVPTKFRSFLRTNP